MKRRAILVFGTVVAIAAAPGAVALEYTLIDLGSLGGSTSTAYRINDKGQIVGVAKTSSGADHACLFDPSGEGGNTDLGTLGGDPSWAYHINNNGHIVGSSVTIFGGEHACLFDPSGRRENTDLGTLGGRSSIACSMNDIGQIVGRADNGTGHYRACLFDSSGKDGNTDLGTLDGAYSRAYYINNKGQIVGEAATRSGISHACLFDPSGEGDNIDLGTLGGDDSRARFINDAGQVVGEAETGSGFLHACLFDPSGGGANTDLGTLGGTDSCANHINNKSQIVGWARDASLHARACLFDPSGEGDNIDLNLLLPSGCEWVLEQALSINQDGWIVGLGYAPDGEFRGYLIMPRGPIHNVTQDTYHSTIQAAVDDANEGDTIVVPVGTYTDDGNRDIDFKGKAITLRSEDPSDPNVVATTIIDCNGTAADPHRGFYFHSGETTSSVLEGFTITNGYGPSEAFGASAYSAGGAIYCANSSPTIRNCVFADNYSNYWGGGLWFSDSRAAVEGCTIRGNTALNTGGGLYNRLSGITVANCLFIDNSANAGGGMYNIDGNPSVRNTLFAGNSAATSGGGGLGNRRVTSTITNCTFFDNQASSGGAIHNTLSEGTIISNCIIWANPASEIKGGAEVSYCDVRGGRPGEGNIDADPCFADAEEGDFHLRSKYGRWDPIGQVWVVDSVTSPCIDAGDPSSPVGDEPIPNGDRINLGVYGGTQQASRSPGCSGHLLSDLNRDCRVDFFDFAIFVNQWLECNWEDPELCR